NTNDFANAEGSVVIRGQAVPLPSDPGAMARIAQESGGKSFTAKSANQLHAVYDQIGRAVGYVVHKHEVTEWFTGLGLALAALAGGAALIWSSRIVLPVRRSLGRPANSGVGRSDCGTRARYVSGPRRRMDLVE